MKKLSIIVPVYQVERYIRPCIESIFKQGLDDTDFELIIVNDGTKDRSMEMIADIISQHDNIIVINQENQSLSVARNNGIAKAQGEYIFMPDSDDLLIENSLAPLLAKATETKVDLVLADAVEIYADEMPPDCKVQNKILSIEKKTGHQLFIEDLNPYRCQVWRMLYRRDFLIQNQLKFVPGIHYQDVPFTHECILKANQCLKASWLIYIYRRAREGSNTALFNKRNAHDLSIAISKTWELTNIAGLSPALRTKLESDVYTSFIKLVFSVIHYIKGSAERIEVISFLHRQAPQLRFTFAFQPKVESIVLHWSPRLYMTIRYLIWKWKK